MDRLAAANGGAASSLFLSRTGERISRGRVISGGNATGKGAGVLALRREINELRSMLEDQQRSASEHELNLRSTDERLARLDEAQGGTAEIKHFRKAS